MSETGIAVTVRSGLSLTLEPKAESELYRIAQEAISNSIRHGHASWVQIQLYQTQSRLILSIADNGVGMDAATQQRAFEAFFTTGRHKGGSGLGMAIVHNLVTTALQGTIEIQSELGQGTAVIVTFPRAIAD